MSYQKQNFANGEVLSASQLNHIEDGIVDVESVANATKTVVDNIIDPTLTLSGKAADAAKVGEAVNAESERAKGVESQLKEDVAAITPDDTTVNGKPWTSKKIVDTICQPFEESGNPVQVYPVEGYPLGVKVSWEPVQRGSGTPSPDNIRAINGRNKVAVTCCGENLINTRNINFTLYGVTVRSDDEGNITVTGKQSGGGWIVVASVKLPAGTYYFSSTHKSIFTPLVEYTQVAVGKIVLTKMSTVRIGIAGIPVDGITGKVMIVRGDTAPAEYISYVGQTNTLTLPKTVYGGEVDAVSGDAKETWKMLTLNGKEGWFVTSDGVWRSSDNILKNAKQGTIICTHTKISADVPWGYIYLTPIREIGTIDSWKTYLADQNAAGTPVQVCYKLAEPVPFTATGAQPIPEIAGANTVLTDADSVVVTGAEDPKHTITELKNAIISLGGNF